MEINRPQIKEALLRVIDHISDKDYQERVWINGDAPEVDDFDETVCNFSEPVQDVILNYKEFGLSDEQHQILESFFIVFAKFANDNDFPELFISTSEWQHVVDEAKKVLKAFNYKKP